MFWVEFLLHITNELHRVGLPQIDRLKSDIWELDMIKNLGEEIKHNS